MACIGKEKSEAMWNWKHFHVENKKLSVDGLVWGFETNTCKQLVMFWKCSLNCWSLGYLKMTMVHWVGCKVPFRSETTGSKSGSQSGCLLSASPLKTVLYSTGTWSFQPHYPCSIPNLNVGMFSALDILVAWLGSLLCLSLGNSLGSKCKFPNSHVPQSHWSDLPASRVIFSISSLPPLFLGSTSSCG